MRFWLASRAETPTRLRSRRDLQYETWSSWRPLCLEVYSSQRSIISSLTKTYFSYFGADPVQLEALSLSHQRESHWIEPTSKDRIGSNQTNLSTIAVMLY